VSLFEKTPINELITKQNYKTKSTDNHNQLTIFDL